MRAWLALVAGGFGLAAYLGRRRKAARAEVEPADELRATLARSRSEQPQAEPVAAEPVPVAEPVAGSEELDGRRRDVHERARRSIDELG